MERWPNFDASCKITPISIDINREWDSLSPFEQLPRELVWEIIERVPEAVFHLRMTSRVLKAIVDDYAKQSPRTMFIDDLELRRDHSDIREINMHISKSKWHLFALGCILREYELDSDAFSKYSSRKYGDCVLLAYQWDQDDSVPDYVRDIIGKRIGKATLTNAYDLHIFSNFLEGVQYKTLDFSTPFIHEFQLEELLEFIENSDIDELYCDCGDENSLFKSEDFLLELASLVKTLHIKHLNDCRQFLCIWETDWGELFMGMLSRKLEKLHISSAFPFHLQTGCFEFLAQQLPVLGRKLCLSVYYNPACHWCRECRNQRDVVPKCITINCDKDGALNYLTEDDE